MLLGLILSLLAVFVLLVVTEALWRAGKLEAEASRKTIHIGTGVIIAFWPYFLSWGVIAGLMLLFLAVVLVSRKLSIFKSIHSVERLTRGEVLYPVGIGLCALLQPAPWVFTLAILHLALADGIAAIVGTRYGKRTRYFLLSHGKSAAGSLAFFTTSFAIFALGSLLVPDNGLPPVYGGFLLAALALTLIENVSWYGLDDVTVPVSAIVVVTLLAG